MLALACCSGLTSALHAQEAPEQAEIEYHKIGHHRLQLPGVPYRVYYQTRLRYGWEPARSSKERYQRTPDEAYPFRNYDKVSWDVTAPEDYDPARPAGVLVYVRPKGNGRVPEEWKESLGTLNLIFVSISSGETTRPHHYAHAMAVHAPTLIKERYTVHPGRVYIAGLLNGGHVANAGAALTPDTFRAAFMIHGGGFLQDVELRGTTLEGLAPKADRRVLRESAQRAQLIYFNGRSDVEREIVLAPAAAYRRAGFRQLTVWDEPGSGDSLPDAERLTEAIAIFDQPLHRDAERAYKRATRDIERGRRDRGLPTLLEVASSAPTTDFGSNAREQADTLRSQYTEQVEAIEAQIEAGQFDQAKAAIDTLRRDWGDLARQDRGRLEDTIRDAERG